MYVMKPRPFFKKISFLHTFCPLFFATTSDSFSFFFLLTFNWLSWLCLISVDTCTHSTERNVFSPVVQHPIIPWVDSFTENCSPEKQGHLAHTSIGILNPLLAAAIPYQQQQHICIYIYISLNLVPGFPLPFSSINNPCFSQTENFQLLKILSKI